MVNEDIGKRLRHVRQVHGLSQRALAKKAGVVNSTISLIEAGRTNPSVGALKRILDAILIQSRHLNRSAQFFSTSFPALPGAGRGQPRATTGQLDHSAGALILSG